MFRILEKGYDGHYSVRRLRDKKRPQFAAFVHLCHDLIALAEVPRELNEYAEE